VLSKTIYSLEKIETPRMILRPVQLGDEIVLNNAVNNSLPLLQKWQPWAKDPSIEATREFIQHGVFAWESNEVANFPMVIIHKSDQKIIAASGYNDRSNPGKGIYEIGYWLDIDYQGQGLVTEYVNALTRYALQELNAKKVLIRMQIENEKSIAVAKRLNYILKGTKDRDLLDCVDHQKAQDYVYACYEIEPLPALEPAWYFKGLQNNDAAMIAWAKQELNIQDDKRFNQSKAIVKTPWSNVIEINTQNSSVYLKQTPPDLFVEPEVINFIQKNMSDNATPKVLFINQKLNCFIMNSCGDYSLRTKFNGLIDAELLINGIKSYIKIQRSLEQYFDDVGAINIPDWRINHIPDLYVDLLEKTDILLEDGLTLDEIDQLMRLVPTIKSICESLSKHKIKETLVNCDFNENNMIINEDTQQISIIDWGESVISHPFFTLASHLRNTTRRYQLASKGQLVESIKQNCLSCWSDVVNKNELDEIYQNILRLLPIFSSLSIYRLQAATNNKSKGMQRWFIKGCLQTLLKN